MAKILLETFHDSFQVKPAFAGGEVEVLLLREMCCIVNT